MRPEDLVRKLADQEKSLLSTEIFSPYSPELSAIVTRISGIKHRLTIKPRDSVGFGIFRINDHRSASFIRNASDSQIDEYLQILPKVKAILMRDGDNWACVPTNAVSYVKIGFSSPTQAMLVENAESFDYIVGRFDGCRIWFSHQDPNCDISKILSLRECLKTGKLLNIPKTTPEDEFVFKWLLDRDKKLKAATVEGRLKESLEDKGARLDSYRERGNHIEVKWKSKAGNYYTSVVNKEFGVISAGICLSGQDHKFDLHSLIGIVTEGERKHQIVPGDFRDGQGHLDDEDE